MIGCSLIGCSMISEDTTAQTTANVPVGTWVDFSHTVNNGDIEDVWVETSLAGMNFSRNGNTVRVYGTPQVAGTYEVFISIFLAEWEEFDGTTLYVTAYNPSFTVSFNSMGGTGVASQSVSSGACATAPANPTNGVNVFGGWFTDQACTQAFNFSTPIYNNITLYAKWTTPNASVTSSHGNSTMTVGQLFSYNVSTSPGNATISVSGANWLTVSGHTIYGTPTTPGTYNVTITSSASGYNSGSQSFTITVSSVLAPGNTPSNGVIAYVR